VIRGVALAAPAAAGVGASVATARVVPAPDGAALVAWWAGILLLCTIVAASVERVARRLLPLAVLLRLSLAFPDRAPSRFAVARRYGNVRVLEERIRIARERGVDDDPSRAAAEILSLVAALSAHDRKTRGHSERVRAFTDLIAAELDLPEEDRDRLRWAALLHDVGKIRVPSRILNKPGKPDQREWEVLQGHPAAGARIAAPLLPWLGPWASTIEQHHERFGGGGYPRGVAGEEIGLGARIVSVADSFEVMTAARSYKKPMSVAAARAELAGCAGSQFDPDVVRSLLAVSIGRLWWTTGPAAWIASTPVLGALQRVAGQAAVAAQGAAIVAAVGVTGIVAPASAARAGHQLPRARPVPAAADLVATTGGDPTRPASIDPVPGGRGSTGGGHHRGGSGAGGDPTGTGDPTAPTGTGGGLTDAVGGTTDAVGSAVRDATGTVTDTVDGAVDTATDVIDGTVGTVGGTVGGVVNGGGVTSTADAVDDTVSSANDAVRGLLP